MIFDVRLPIGLLFLAIGILVGGYGLTGHVAPSAGRQHRPGLGDR